MTGDGTAVAEVRDEPVRRRWRPSWPTAAALVILLLGVAVRAYWTTTLGAQVDADEAVTGIMAQRIAHTGQSYSYFAGQEYNGSLEQYLQAFLVKLGAPDGNPATLFAVSILFCALTALVVYAAARLMFESDIKALVALLLFSVGSFYLIYKGTRSDGAYGSTQFFAALGWYSVLLASRSQRWRHQLAGVFGLCVGLSVWGGLTGLLLLFPAFVWAALRGVDKGYRLIPAAAAGAVVGAMPAWIWVIRHGRLQQLGGPQPPSTVGDRLGHLAGPIFREFLGVSGNYDTGGWPTFWQDVAVYLVAAAWVALLVRRVWTLIRPRPGTVRTTRYTDMFFFVPPVVVAFFALSSYAWYIGQPRYVFSAYPFLCWFLAALVPSGVKAVSAAVAVAISAVMVATALHSLDEGHATLSANYIEVDATDTQYRQMCGYLERHDETDVYADYWTGMPLQYYCRGQVVVGPMTSGALKFRDLRRRVDASPRFVYVAPGSDPRRPHGISHQLRHFRVRFEVTQVGPLLVYSDFSRAMRPWDLRIGTRLPG